MRPQDWPQRLFRFVEARRSTPFDWRTHNCAFFACDWINELTGIDPATSFRPRVTSALSAQRAIVAAGGLEKIADDACAANGWPIVPVACAQRGDVVALDTKHGPALGVCVDDRAAFVGKSGVVFSQIKNCRKAWRIG